MADKFVSVLDRMRSTWDRCAEEDALGHAAARPGIEVDDYRASGEAIASRWLGDPTGADPAPGERRALDLGCGAGRLLLPLAERSGEVHGVDVSPGMLAAARSLVGDDPRVHLHLGDGMTLRALGRLRFDLIVAHDVLPHLPDLALVRYVLRQVGYRLAPHGVAVFDLDAGAAGELAGLLSTAGLSERSRRAEEARVVITAGATAADPAPA